MISYLLEDGLWPTSTLSGAPHEGRTN